MKVLLPWIPRPAGMCLLGILLSLGCRNGSDPPGGNGDPPPPTANGGTDSRPENGKESKPDDDFRKQRSAAYDHQKRQAWCEAQAVWEKLRDTLASRAENDQVRRVREEAEQNLRLLEPLCRPTNPPVEEVKLPKDPRERKDDPPAPVDEEDFLAYYPEGRNVRSLMILNTSGEGSNQKWIFKGRAKFAHQHRVAVESTVIKNNGSRLVAELLFREASQTLAVSDRELELSLPDAPLLALVWERLEDKLLRGVPVYEAARTVAQFGDLIDPRAKRSLTWFAEHLRRYGVKLDDSDHVELLARIEQLDGMKLEVEYVSGLGVTRIKVLQGQAYDRDDLERLAYSMSLLLDYYIFPGAKKEPGERWDVRAEDVAGLLNLGHEVEVRGKLTLEREKSGSEEQAVLKIVAAEVDLAGRRDRHGQEAKVTSRAGRVFFSKKDLLIREARVDWSGSWRAVSSDHLLFGTEQIRNLKVEAYYEADRIDEVPR